MLSLDFTWEAEGEQALITLDDPRGPRRTTPIALSSATRLALALQEDADLPEVHRQALVDELLRLVPCAELLKQTGHRACALRVLSRGLPFAQVQIVIPVGGSPRRAEVVEGEAAPERAKGRPWAGPRLSLARALVLCVAFTALALISPLDALLWRPLLALLGSSPRELQGLPDVGILLIPSALAGRNDRGAMAEALSACADRQPAWIAVDVPFDRREPEDEPLWQRVGALRSRTPLLVGVSQVSAAPDAQEQAGPVSVMDPSGGPPGVGLQQATLVHLPASGALGAAVPDLSLAIAARLNRGALIHADEERSVRGLVRLTTPDIVDGQALARKLKCARWSAVEPSRVAPACAPDQGVILSFTDWELPGDVAHRDLHDTWIAGPGSLPEACQRAPQRGDGDARLPGPVYLAALGLTVAAGSPYRTVGEAFSEAVSRLVAAPVSIALGGRDPQEQILLQPRNTAGSARLAGVALYMALLLSPLSGARRPLSRAPMVLHLLATLGFLFGFRVLSPVCTGALLALLSGKRLSGGGRVLPAQTKGE